MLTEEAHYNDSCKNGPYHCANMSRGGHSPFHAEREAAKAAGASVPEMPTLDPHHLAVLLWTMHSTRSRPEATYPERLFNH
jgi:hypothetical protein